MRLCPLLKIQDIWEREVDELLGNFNDNATEDDLHIVAIFDSAYSFKEIKNFRRHYD